MSIFANNNNYQSNKLHKAMIFQKIKIYYLGRETISLMHSTFLISQSFLHKSRQ